MIEGVIRYVVSQTVPSSGINLEGFVFDVEHGLQQHPLFDSVRIQETGNPICMLDVRVNVSTSAQCIQDISKALQEVWQDISYSHFQAFSCERYQEAVVFRFVTVAEHNQFFVSGQIVATSDAYPALALNYQRTLSTILSHLKDHTLTLCPRVIEVAA